MVLKQAWIFYTISMLTAESNQKDASHFCKATTHEAFTVELMSHIHGLFLGCRLRLLQRARS